MKQPPLIVPDVNVLVSGATLSGFAPSQVMQAWQKGLIEFATSELILDEARRVFTYPKVRQFVFLTPQEIDLYLTSIREGAVIVAGSTPIHVSPDPDDDKFFVCAIEAQADYIVSMDKWHVLCIGDYQGIQTIHPSDFVREVLAVAEAA